MKNPSSSCIHAILNVLTLSKLIWLMQFLLKIFDWPLSFPPGRCGISRIIGTSLLYQQGSGFVLKRRDV